MPEEPVEVVQPKPGEAVTTDQPTDGGAAPAEAAPELPEGEKPAGDEVTPEAGETPAGETPKGGLDKRFAELTRARKEAERVAQTEKLRADQAIEALVRLGKETPKAVETPSEDVRPQMPDFSDPETFARDMASYTEQLTMWAARQAVKADRAEVEKKRTEDERKQYATRVQSEFATRRKKALEMMPDYSEIAENPDLQITEVMASAIAIDAEGPAVAYYLGQNPDEADRIAKLSPGQQLIELGVVKATLLAKRTSQPNRLPIPLKTVTGATTTGKSLDDLDMDAYAAKAKSEGRVKIQ